DSVLDRLDDVFRIILTGQHVGIGHAGHGNVFVALAASVAGVFHAHETSRKLVAEIALEDSLLDQHGLLSRVALVIEVQRAAAPGHGAVVDDGASLAGYALADQSGESGSFLTVEIGFESVAYGFVQKNSGPTGAEDDFHFSRGSFAGVELQNRLAGGFTGEKVGGDAASAAGGAAGRIVFGFRNTRNVHAGQGLGIFSESAVGADY